MEIKIYISGPVTGEDYLERFGAAVSLLFMEI